MGFTFRIACMVGIIILFSIVLNTLLSIYSFQKTYKSMASDRFTVIGKDMKRAIDFGLTLGLELDGIRNMESILSKTKAKHPAVQSISIVNERGIALFHTEPALIGQPVLTEWLHGLAAPKNAVWRMDDDGGYGVVFSLHNNFGVLVGYLCVRYDRTEMAQTFDRISIQFELTAMAATVACLVLAFLAVSLFTRNAQRSFHWFEATLRHLTGTGKPLGTSPQGTMYADEFDAYAAQSAKTLAELNERNMSMDHPDASRSS